MEKYKVNFVFKKKEGNKSSLVLFRANSKLIKGGRFQISTGETLRTDKPIKVNNSMKDVESAFKDAFENHYTGNELRYPKDLKILVNNILYPYLEESKPTKRLPTITEFVKSEIDKNHIRTKNKVTEGTVKNWKSLYNNLMWYDKSITFENASLSWIESFHEWLLKPHDISGTRSYNQGRKLKSQGVSEETAWKYIKGLKRMLKKAERNPDIKVNQDYKKLEKEERSKETKYSGVYLSIEEQRQLKNLVLSPSRSLVRDWVLIACSTGQRYSDWDKLRPENITHTVDGDVIEFIQQKTKAKVAVPVGKTVWVIWEKYPKGMKLPSDQQVRTVIKELCKTIGLTDDIAGKPKYKHIGTHIGRYSFVSNSIDQDIPDKTIMAITGHFDKDVFSSYLKLTQAKLAKKAHDYPLFNQAL